MQDKPQGKSFSCCPKCGAKLSARIPDGDNRLRWVCDGCDFILYENPLTVVGCVSEFEGRILLCKRAIEPRLGYWTVPAGFMELGETLAEAATRETLEEACAEIEISSLLAIVDVVQAGQVHVFFRGSMKTANYGAGEESLETRLFSPDEIPWADIAFQSGYIALKQYLEQQKSGVDVVHMDEAGRLGHN